jgi:hypothetical protein
MIQNKDWVGPNIGSDHRRGFKLHVHNLVTLRFRLNSCKESATKISGLRCRAFPALLAHDPHLIGLSVSNPHRSENAQAVHDYPLSGLLQNQSLPRVLLIKLEQKDSNSQLILG